MWKNILAILMMTVLLTSLTACSGSRNDTLSSSSNREIILGNDNTNEERNRLLTEDIQYFKQELPKRHKNLFSNISKKEFNKRTDQLLNKVDQLNNKQVFVELNKIVASVGDAHTSINIYDGYHYPLQFWIFDGKVYVVNTDKSLKAMMYSQVLKINGMDIGKVMERLTLLISHENDNCILAMLPNYLLAPVYMYGLGIIKNENETKFTVQKDGKIKDFTVKALEYEKNANFVNQDTKDAFIGRYDTYYDYKYLSDCRALYFEYNACADMQNLKFTDFNKKMFDDIEKNDIDRIIVDLRSNSGGNSEVLNPFTSRLKGYIAENPKVKVYILVGRGTFSSGMFAIYRVKEAAPEAISVGEPTGGALDCYGDIKSFNLPNSGIPVNYSTKYFEFSKSFRYKNGGVGTFLPDIIKQPTIEDYKNGTDVALDYALTD